MKTVDVIIPVYNERDNLPLLLRRLQALPVFQTLNLIFVDNASTDGSVAYLAALPEITLIKHRSNLGYGASLRSGLQVAQNKSVVIIDADCEYPPECIPHLLHALQTQAVVYASRLAGKTAATAGMPFLKWFGNVIISSVYNLLYQQKISDLYTGCKALRRECLRAMDLQRDGFEQVLELAVKLAQQGIKIAEIPVDFSPRLHGASKMSHLAETAKYFFWLLCYRLLLPKNSAHKDESHG